MSKKPRKKKLTPKEAAFCRHYVDTRNGAKAARLAGYSENTAAEIAYENLRKPHIAEEIAKLTTEALGDEDQNKREVLLLLKQTMNSDISDMIEITTNDKGQPTVSLKDGADTHLIQEIGNYYHGIKIKTYSKLEAADKLMRHYAMFKDLGTKDNPFHYLMGGWKEKPD